MNSQNQVYRDDLRHYGEFRDSAPSPSPVRPEPSSPASAVSGPARIGSAPPSAAEPRQAKEHAP